MRIGYVNQGGVKTGLDGSVTYDFQGHVHATGLDLDAGTSSTVPNDSRARWLNTLGAVVADIYGYTFGGAAGMIAEVADPGGPGRAGLFLSAAASPGVIAFTQNGSARILYGDNESDFVRPGDTDFVKPGDTSVVNAISGNLIQLQWHGLIGSGGFSCYVDSNYVGELTP
jgi:hypothetical protein